MVVGGSGCAGPCFPIKRIDEITQRPGKAGMCPAAAGVLFANKSCPMANACLLMCANANKIMDGCVWSVTVVCAQTESFNHDFFFVFFFLVCSLSASFAD